MRYDEFRDQLQNALREAGLFSEHVHRPTEIINLASTGRRWKLHIWRAESQSADPFHVSARVAFDWSPFDAARGYTCEEDLLTELFGRRQRRTKTERRWKRVDLKLYASLPYGSTTPVPDPQVFGSWTASAGERLDRLFTEFKERQQRVVAVLGGREEVEAQCKVEGVLSLMGMSASAFRLVRIPRIWDDPDWRDAEKDIGAELTHLARRFKDGFDAWTESVAELAAWIRYSPPPPGSKPVEPWFENDEEDNGSGTVH